MGEGGDWDTAASSGIMGGIDLLGEALEGCASIGRSSSYYLFVGDGPYSLYTEVRICKSDGVVMDTYVEID